jgi:hypothetical protein
MDFSLENVTNRQPVGTSPFSLADSSRRPHKTLNSLSAVGQRIT